MILPVRFNKNVTPFIFFVGLSSALVGLWLYTQPKVTSAINNIDALSYVSQSNGLVPLHESAVTPIRIIISELGIDIPINEGFYNYSSNEWTLSDNGAQYINSNIYLSGQIGGVYVYGHNTPEVFGGLPKLSIGSTVVLKTATGDVQYKLHTVKTVSSDSVDVLTGTDAAADLIIQTCSGSFAQNRELFYFVVVE